jgi:hypothetical protein
MKNKLDNNDVLKFIFGGNSTFTALNTRSGSRFTFKMQISDDSKIFFVKVLTGPEHFEYIGVCKSGDFFWGKKSKISKDAQSIKVFEYLINKLKAQKLPDFVEIWHMGLCGKCAKPLTNPESIKMGIGPDCLKKLSKADRRDKFLNSILW